MFKDDDDKDEGAAFGITRYPCMPSLVALQQMRNRLHLAFLGKKLMKWTALATGREMRRIAQELYEVYAGFGEDLRNAFILLARSRYFYPHLNTVVLENIADKAAVVVQQSVRTVSAVKIVQFEIVETEYPPYVHLGLEKGGQSIADTKKAWLELLKRLIMMMQLRTSFLMVELAHNNANKKMNVLGKVVIPRTNVTMSYINNELEEYAREEFFRLKKVLEIKRKMYGDRSGTKAEKTGGADDITRPEYLKEPEELRVPVVRIAEEIIEPEIKKEEEIIEPEIKAEEEIRKPAIQFSIEEEPETSKLEQDDHIAELIKQLSDIVDVTKEMDKKGLVTASTDNFIKTATEFKEKLMSQPDSKDFEKVEEENAKLEEELEDMEKESLKDETDLNKLCETYREKYNMQSKETQSVIFIDTPPMEEETQAVDKEILIDTPSMEEESKETVQSKQHLIATQLEDDTQQLGDESDLQLGTFETEYKEITKITRTLNEDGSITVEKRVVKIEKQIMPDGSKSSRGLSQAQSADPSANISYQGSSTSSGRSKPYSDSKTVETLRVPFSDYKSDIFSRNKIEKKVKSKMFNDFTQMSDSTARSCFSSISLLSRNLACHIDSINSKKSLVEEIIFSPKIGCCHQSHSRNSDNLVQRSNIIEKSLNEAQANKESQSSRENNSNEIDSCYSNSFSDTLSIKKSKLGLSVSFNNSSSATSEISSPSVILKETEKNKKKEQ